LTAVLATVLMAGEVFFPAPVPVFAEVRAEVRGAVRGVFFTAIFVCSSVADA